MFLIPEQVKALRDEIKKLELELNDSMKYYKNNQDDTKEESDFVDTSLEDLNCSETIKKLQLYRNILEQSEFISKINFEMVDYGTKFKVKFDDSEEIETYTLTENSTGLISTSLNQDSIYISIDEPLGKALKGKKENEEFSCCVPIKEKKDSIEMKGRIIEIFKNTSVDFITNRPKSYRIAKQVSVKRKVLHESGDITLLDKMYKITYSQYLLLEEERNRLSFILQKMRDYYEIIRVGSIISIKDDKGNISKYKIVDKNKINIRSEISIKSLLGSRIAKRRKGDNINESIAYKTASGTRYKNCKGKIIDVDNSKILKFDSIYSNESSIYIRLGGVLKLLKERKIASTPLEDEIGIGSKFSIITFENGQIQNRRVELINQAVSTELSTDYIEAISPLGRKLLGLKNNQQFEYYYEGSKLGGGVVYDINNNMYEDLALSPLDYVKRNIRRN